MARRTAFRRCSRPATGLAVAALATSLSMGGTAREAHAAPSGERWQELAWVYASPLLLAVPLAQRDFFELRATWQWSIGGGYMLQPTDHFWVMPGGSFEHMILNPSTAAGGGHVFRIQPEARIGGGWDRMFIYGLAGLGPSITTIKITPTGEETTFRRTDGGFNLQIGAGALFHVWDALSVGGELDADLSWSRNSSCNDNCGYAIHTLGIKAVVGYQF